jgi:hypothetical protein
MKSFSSYENKRLIILRIFFILILLLPLFLAGKHLYVQILNLFPVELSEKELNNAYFEPDSENTSNGISLHDYSNIASDYPMYRQSDRYRFILDLKYVYDPNVVLEQTITYSNIYRDFTDKKTDSIFAVCSVFGDKNIIVRVLSDKNISGKYTGIIRSIPAQVFQFADFPDELNIEKNYYFDTVIGMNGISLVENILSFIIFIFTIVIIFKFAPFQKKSKQPFYNKLLQYDNDLDINQKCLLIDNEIDKFGSIRFKFFAPIYTERLVITRGLINTRVMYRI